MASQLAPCLRSELGVPMVVFGGVLLISTAFCGAVDAMNPSLSSKMVDEVQVVQAENVVSPEADLMAACKKDQDQVAHGDIRCDQDRFQSASVH